MSSGNLRRALLTLVATAFLLALPSIARAEGPSIDPNGITDSGGSIDPNGFTDEGMSIDPHG